MKNFLALVLYNLFNDNIKNSGSVSMAKGTAFFQLALVLTLAVMMICGIVLASVYYFFGVDLYSVIEERYLSIEVIFLIVDFFVVLYQYVLLKDFIRKLGTAEFSLVESSSRFNFLCRIFPQVAFLLVVVVVMSWVVMMREQQ